MAVSLLQPQNIRFKPLGLPTCGGRRGGLKFVGSSYLETAFNQTKTEIDLKASAFLFHRRATWISLGYVGELGRMLKYPAPARISAPPTKTDPPSVSCRIKTP